MSKQAGQTPYQGMIPGASLPNGLKDSEAAGNAFDIRLPDIYGHHGSNNNNNYDVFSDSFDSKLLGRDLFQGIMGDETSAPHYNDHATTSNTNNNNNNNNKNNVAMSSSSGKNLEKIWNSDENQLASSNHSSSSDFSSAFMPFSNNEGRGFLRRSFSNTDEVSSNAVGSSSSSSSVIGSNSNNNAIGNNNNSVNNNNNNSNSSIGNNNNKGSTSNVFLNMQLDSNNQATCNTNNNSDNLSSKLSSGVESPINVAADSSASNTDNNGNNNNNLGFLETTKIMHERINSNEGWGRKPIRQDTPWVLEGSMYSGRRDDLDPPSQPNPQPDMQGPFWDQNTRISNCSESDRNFGVWTEPGRNNNLSMAGASGVGIWKTNLNMAGKPELQAATPQQQLPPHLFQQQQQQQQWNSADPRFLLAAVAQRLSEEDSKPKWSSSSSTPWEDKNLLTSLVNNPPSHPNNPWNSSQRMEGLQSEINSNLLQHILSLGIPLENAQKFAQSNDLLGKNKFGGGGGSFDNTRGRPLFAQKMHNTAPSPLPQPFNPPPNRLDFNQPSLLHSNIFSPGNNPNNLPPFNPQENVLKTQQLLMALQQQQQQQQLQQNNNNTHTPDFSAMMMMMMNDAKAGGDASKEAMLSQLMSNMRVDNRWVPGNNNNNSNNSNDNSNNNNWNLPHQDDSVFFNNNSNNNSHLFNNTRLPNWQNKVPHPNTANVAYNWLFIKNFSGDPPSLQYIGQQNRAMKYFGGLHSNSVLVFFQTTEDAMKAKAQFAMAGMQFELLDNATANRELQSGMWNQLPPTPHHHHQSFLPRPPLAPGAMWPPVRY